MSSIRALFCAKDLGSAGMILPLVKEWQKAGHEAVVVTEGLAGAKFQEAGLPVFFKGTENFVSVPFTLDVEAALEAIRPSAVVVGESAPCHLEKQIAKAANILSIPLVAVDDLWGGFRRLDARPDLILTLDELGVRKAKEAFPDVSVSVVGNPGVPSEKELSELKELQVPALTSLKNSYVKVITFVGGGKESTLKELQLLLECLKLTPKSWCLVVSFHPKWRKVLNPEGKEYGDVWSEALSSLGNRVRYTHELGISSRDAVVGADLVVAGVSTLMTTAAALGKPVVSLTTPEVLEVLRSEGGLDEVPQVSLGLAKEVVVPENLLSESILDPDVRKMPVSYDPVQAALAVQDFLRK